MKKLIVFTAFSLIGFLSHLHSEEVKNPSTDVAVTHKINSEQPIQEQIGIHLNRLKYCHQREWRNLSIELKYEVQNGHAPNATNVQEFVVNFLDTYENQDDFWEVINTTLIHKLVETYPQIEHIESKLSVAPDAVFHFPRASIVLYHKNDQALKESFRFTKLGYSVCNSSFKKVDMDVVFNIKENPAPFDYPDYLWVDEAIEEFLREKPISFNEWLNIKPELESFLLERFPTLTSMKVDLKISGS